MTLTDTNMQQAEMDQYLPQSHHSELVTQSPVSILVVEGGTFRIRFCNKIFHELTGYTPADFYPEGFGFLQLLEPSRRDHFIAELHHFAAGNGAPGRSFMLYHIRHRDGSLSQYYLYVRPCQVPEGCDSYEIVMVPEESGWKLPYVSLETREIFLEQFADFGFGTYEWILDSGQLFWSDGVYDIYEVEKGTPVSFDQAMEHQEPSQKPMLLDLIKKTLSQGTPFETELCIRTTSGKTKYLLATGKRIDSEGQPAKLVGCVRNITPQKTQSTSLTNHIEELNRSNKELEEFAYVTSHDLQEPLRKVSTFSDRLRDKIGGQLDDDCKFYLDRIIAATGNMRLLINNLLDYSLVSKGAGTFTRVNLGFLLKEVVQELELKISETNTKIFTDPLPEIDADPSQIKQLFFNLISNAIKFWKQKPGNDFPQITISCRPLSAQEQKQHLLSSRSAYYRISVCDNGIGFEQQYSDKIFQMFQRLHGKSEFAGSGVGLAICKKVTDNHEGAIYAENVPGAGACFNIILPQDQKKDQ